MRLFAVTLAAVGFAAISSSDLRSEIKDMNAQMGNAMRRGDMKAITAIIKAGCTKDFSYVEAGKSSNMDQMLTNMKAGLSAMKTTSAKASLLTLKEKGSNAVATEKHEVAGIMTDKNKKTHRIVFIGTSTDTYVKVGKEWKMSKMEWTANKMTMDGKPMDPSKMGS